MQTSARTGLLLICALAAGCSGGLVPVSGIVTVDDKPLVGGSVTFHPLDLTETKASWGEAYGRTDAEGRYTLRQVLGDRPGAGPGKYRVSITSGTAKVPDPLSNELPPPGTTEPIPPRYNAHSELTLDVPPSGTDQANFKLSSKSGPKGPLIK